MSSVLTVGTKSLSGCHTWQPPGGFLTVSGKMRNAFIVFSVFLKILVLVGLVTHVVSGGNKKSGLELQTSLSSLLARNTAEGQLVFQSTKS